MRKYVKFENMEIVLRINSNIEKHIKSRTDYEHELVLYLSIQYNEYNGAQIDSLN